METHPYQGLVVECIFSKVTFIGLKILKYKGKKLLHYPFLMYHHLWTQHHLFIMLRILRSWIFNLLTKWNGLNIIYLLCLESYFHGSLILVLIATYSHVILLKFKLYTCSFLDKRIYSHVILLKFKLYIRSFLDKR